MGMLQKCKMPPEMESQIARTSLRSILKQVAKSITPADVQQLNAALNKIKKRADPCVKSNFL